MKPCLSRQGRKELRRKCPGSWEVRDRMSSWGWGGQVCFPGREAEWSVSHWGTQAHRSWKESVRLDLEKKGSFHGSGRDHRGSEIIGITPGFGARFRILAFALRTMGNHPMLLTGGVRRSSFHLEKISAATITAWTGEGQSGKKEKRLGGYLRSPGETGSSWRDLEMDTDKIDDPRDTTISS